MLQLFISKVCIRESSHTSPCARTTIYCEASVSGCVRLHLQSASQSNVLCNGPSMDYRIHAYQSDIHPATIHLPCLRWPGTVSRVKHQIDLSGANEVFECSTKQPQFIESRSAFAKSEGRGHSQQSIIAQVVNGTVYFDPILLDLVASRGVELIVSGQTCQCRDCSDYNASTCGRTSLRLMLIDISLLNRNGARETFCAD